MRFDCFSLTACCVYLTNRCFVGNFFFFVFLFLFFLVINHKCCDILECHDIFLPSLCNRACNIFFFFFYNFHFHWSEIFEITRITVMETNKDVIWRCIYWNALCLVLPGLKAVYLLLQLSSFSSSHLVFLTRLSRVLCTLIIIFINLTFVLLGCFVVFRFTTVQYEIIKYRRSSSSHYFEGCVQP